MTSDTATAKTNTTYPLYVYTPNPIATPAMNHAHAVFIRKATSIIIAATVVNNGIEISMKADLLKKICQYENVSAVVPINATDRSKPTRKRTYDAGIVAIPSKAIDRCNVNKLCPAN